MSDAFFRQVGGGAKFNRTKFDPLHHKRKQAIDNNITEEEHGYRKRLLRDASEKEHSLKTNKLKSQLDFFGTAKAKDTTSNQENSEATKRKLSKPDEPEEIESSEEEEEEEEEEEVVHKPVSLKELQQKHDIHVNGYDVPRLRSSFIELEKNCQIPRQFMEAIQSPLESDGMGYKAPTPIQMQAIPALIAGRELIALAPTGSGKTLAFALPMLTSLDRVPANGESFPTDQSLVLPQEDAKDDATQKKLTGQSHQTLLPFRGIVLAPTRELAHQTFKVFHAITRSSSLWKVNLLTKSVEQTLKSKKRVRKSKKNAESSSQVAEVKAKVDEEQDESDFSDAELDEATLVSNSKKNSTSVRGTGTSDLARSHVMGQTHRQILITTPMRLVQLLKQTNSTLGLVRSIVFDEADRLFDLGFLDQISLILKECTNPSLQRVLCSATVNEGVESLARSILRDPVRVVVGGRNVAQSLVKQRLVYVGTQEGKTLALKQLIAEGLNVPLIAFVQSKERAMQLFDELQYDDIRPGVIHSDLSSTERDKVILNFRTGKVWVLISTDLMSRGIDFKHVNCVLNYDFPQTTASYVHRIGRTGRAGRVGEAITFVTEEDKTLLRLIAHIIRDSTATQEANEEIHKEAYASSSRFGFVSASSAADNTISEWMLNMPKSSVKAMKKLAETAPVRQAINTENREKRLKERLQKQHKQTSKNKNSSFKFHLQSKGESGTSKSDAPKKTAKSSKKKNIKRPRLF